MSFTDTRGAIAAAASTVTGLTGFTFRPKPLKSGQVWPLLGSADRGPGDAFAATWRVMVCLGGEEKAASVKADQVLPLLVDALDPVAYVDSVAPVVLSTEAGDMYALELTCTSE